MKMDNDREYPACYERRKRMQHERERRVRRQRMLKRVLCLGLPGVVLVGIVGAVIFGGKSEAGDISGMGIKGG